MKNELRAPDKPYYPKNTLRTLRKTCVLIDELEARREHEEQFKLTPYEKEMHDQLSETFKVSRPAEGIKSALEDERELKSIRKEYVTASKIQRDRTELKENADNDSLGMVLIAAGTPMMLVGVTLLETFMTAGIGVIAAGAAMYMPMFIREITKKRKARKKLKNITENVDDLSESIDRKMANIDKICSMYGIPVNCTDREQYLSSLFDAATTYEALEKKETDYELLCQLNNSDKIKNQITENIKAMSGLTVVDENNFEDVLDKLASQLK